MWFRRLQIVCKRLVLPSCVHNTTHARTPATLFPATFGSPKQMPSCKTKLDILWLIRVLEADFGRSVRVPGDVVEVDEG